MPLKRLKKKSDILALWLVVMERRVGMLITYLCPGSKYYGSGLVSDNVQLHHTEAEWRRKIHIVHV